MRLNFNDSCGETGALLPERTKSIFELNFICKMAARIQNLDIHKCYVLEDGTL